MAAASNTPSAEMQLRKVKQRWPKGRLVAGETWNVVEARWFRSFCAYVGFTPPGTSRGLADELEKLSLNEPEPPGAIDNQPLQDGDCGELLRKGLVEHQDYELVPHSVWKDVQSWYGGGPAFARKVVAVGNTYETRVELYPQFFRFVWLGEDGEPREDKARYVSYNGKTTLQDVVDALDKKVRPADKPKGSIKVPEGDWARLWMRLPKAPGADADGKDEGKAGETDSDEEDAAAAGGGGDDVDVLDRFAHLPFRCLWSHDERQQPLEALLCGKCPDVWVEERRADSKWLRPHGPKDWQKFKIGQRLDARDNVGKWYEAQIVELSKDGKTMKVHFINWKKKWDLEIKTDSDQLAQLGTWTIGPHRKKPKKAATPTTSTAVTRSSGKYSGYGSGSGSYRSGSGSGSGSYGSRRSSYNNYYSRSESGTPLVRGISGLRNLGNTCFMNSTLQCMAQTPGLVPYFTSRRYTEEINRDNVLGWKGRVAEEFGDLLTNIWSGEYRVVSPMGFKRAIGEFQPRFSGYQQQDSQELLAFLLDGLHEDLNRVYDKPATDKVEGDGRPDTEVAQEAWDTHLLRNRSVVVDHLQGQLKSRVVCPDCGRVSITFDPFMYLTAPLPQAQDTAVNISFIFADPARHPLKISPRVSKVAVVAHLVAKISELVDVVPQRIALAEVYNGRLSRVLKEDDSVRFLANRRTVYAYEVPDLENVARHQVLWMHISNVTEAEAKRSSYPRRFGLPLLRFVDKTVDTTYAEIHKRVIDAVQPFVARDDADPDAEADQAEDDAQPFTPFLSNASQARQVELEPSEDVYKYTRYQRSIEVIASWPGAGEDYDIDRTKPEKADADADDDDDAASAELHVGHCLEAFTREEVLGVGDEWYCSDCSKHQRATKKFDIWKLPDVLVICLKRFSYSRYLRDKITSFVDFPIEGLDMSEYCANPELENPIYDLYAVSNHMGGMGGGHYTAYAKSLQDGQWYLLDDSRTKQVSPKDIKTTAAYVLFYRRRGAASLAADP